MRIGDGALCGDVDTAVWPILPIKRGLLHPHPHPLSPPEVAVRGGEIPRALCLRRERCAGLQAPLKDLPAKGMVPVVWLYQTWAFLTLEQEQLDPKQPLENGTQETRGKDLQTRAREAAAATS